MIGDVAEGIVAAAERTVEMEVFDFGENALEIGAWLEAHRDEIVAADEARRMDLLGGHRGERLAAEMIEAEMGIGAERIEAGQLEQFAETLFGEHFLERRRAHPWGHAQAEVIADEIGDALLDET